MMEFKYKLKERMENIPMKEYKIKERQILNSCGIHRKTLNRWMEIPIEGKHQIGSEDLDRIALVLGCHPDDLKNYTVTINEVA